MRKPYRDSRWKKGAFWLALAPITLAPAWLRYRMADGLAFVLGRVVKYRRGVIDGNLAIAFPERSEGERAEIRRGYYRNFADLALEQIWAFGTTPAAVLEMFEISDEIRALFARHQAAGKPVMVAAGHHNNYELGAAALGLAIDMPMAVIYARLVSPFFDARVLESRTRFGMTLWARGRVGDYMDDWRERHGSFAVGFAFDQSPHGLRRKMWMPFFGRSTAVQLGLDKYVSAYGAAAVFVYLERLRRGKYRLRLVEISDGSADLPEGHVTARATQALEAAIRAHPEGWMWSHRRWKLNEGEHRLPEDIAFLG